MEYLTSLGWIFLGFVLLYFGAEGLVRGSVGLALRLGLSAIVIGLTVVAYGTSMPELVVSIQASLAGKGAIAVGNVIGSNIFNIAVILGLAALIKPIHVKRQMVRIDIPVMIAITILGVIFFRDFSYSRMEGIILFAGVILYTVGNFVIAKKTGLPPEELEEIEGESKKHTPLWKTIGMLMVGLALLVAGADRLVVGAVDIAKLLGLSDAVIGITIIAGGTSLPELATSVVAAIRKESDIALANVVGSNVFNILMILGVAATIAPIDGAGISQLDMYVMLGTAVVLLPMAWSGLVIGRLEGGLLLGGYCVYLGYLINTQNQWWTNLFAA